MPRRVAAAHETFANPGLACSRTFLPAGLPQSQSASCRSHSIVRALLRKVPALVSAALFSPPPGPRPEAGKKGPRKPAPGPSEAVLEQWNEIGRKLIVIAEDLPEEKYDYKPNPDSRTFRALLLHVSASMYYFTDSAQKQKPRYPDDPKPADLKINSKGDLVAFVKQCVKDGADVIKAKGDKGLNESVNDGGPRLIRLGDLAYGLIEHSGEHYGNLVVYYRNNGIVPPESRPKK